MNDNADSGATRRWWLNPALARLAFGANTRATAGSIASALFPNQQMATRDLDDPAQREFGDYELLEMIGRGGMGVIYRARQRGLDREVAIKLLSAGQGASAEFVESFRREAQNAALLQHPNIVVVHEMGEHAGLIFYAMQLVRGRSLSERLDSEDALSPREAASLLRTIAEAVDYAHRLGVLHLDLKPGNILLDQRGEPLVADFGLARRLEQALDNERLAGTPSYMAPEQAQLQGPTLSPATDVWALGAVLYELLTGQPPFDGGEPAATLRLLLEGEVRKPSRLAAVPGDLEAICMKCLAKDPAQRYPDARALADDLGRFLESRAVSVRPLNAPHRVARWARREPRLAIVAGLAVAALLVGVVATSLQWRRAESNAAMSSARLWESRREAALRLEQDGEGNHALPRLLQNIEEQERAGQHNLAGFERRRIGAMLGQGTVLIDRIAITDANPLAVELSDDGSLLAVALSDQSVRWYDTATLSERGRVDLQGRLSSAGEPRSTLLLRFVDNHRLRATLEWYSNQVSPTDGDTWLIDLDRKAVVEPPAAFTDFADASYSADGRYAMLRDHRKAIQLWQVAPWQPLSPRTFANDTGRGDFLPWMIGPEARYGAMLRVSMREMLLFALPDLEQARSMHFPGNAGIAAWARSHGGRWLALGDFEGRVFLLDPVTRELRTLPTSRGREITWLSFSEDDGWLAAVGWDGSAYAFDVARGDSLVAGTMRHDFALQRVGISRARRLLIAAGEGETALWRLPDATGPRAVPAQRIGAGPAPHALAGRYPIGWSLQAGLLASAGVDGQVRLWRLPLPPMVPAIAARQVPEKTWFDGERLVDVEWNRLRIVSVTGAALTPWIELAQPPGFAELIDHGRSLVVTVGPQLRVYDSRTLRLRFTPVALPDSPQRLLASNDATRLLLGFGGKGAAGFEDRLKLYALRNGRRLPGETALAGPLRMLAFSPDGARLLAVGPAEGATTVLTSDGLRRIGEYPHDPFEPVMWADFGGNGRDLVLVTRAEDPRLGSDALLVWDPVADVVHAQHPTARAQPIGVLGTRSGAFVAGMTQDLLYDGGARFRIAERAGRSEATAVLATGPDRRVIAHAFRREVQLVDADTGTAIGPPLQGDSNALDVIVQLAFSADSRALLARTLQGHWLVWRIAADMRPVRQIATALARLNVDNESQQHVRIPDATERVDLRGHDPGRWPALDRRPAPVAAAPPDRSGLPVPARAPDISPLLLDLTPYYVAAPDSVRNTYYSIRSQMRPYPAGVQRIAGIDYDMRGMVEAGSVRFVDNEPSTSIIRCLALPPRVPVAALHLLMIQSLRSPVPDQRTLAELTLHYRDGGRAVLPIRTQREAPGYAGNDQAVPFVFGTSLARMAMGFRGETAVAPRLVNPFPRRAVRCIDLQPFGDSEPMLVFAITVEPAAPEAVKAGPVTSTRVFRTTQTRGTASRSRAAASPPARRAP